MHHRTRRATLPAWASSSGPRPTWRRRAWKARDRLCGALVGRCDEAVLDLLGEVCFAMQDLPAAGAAWFGTTREGPDVEAALAAWSERFGRDPDELWRSLPWPVREAAAVPRVAELARSVTRAERRRRPRVRRGDPGWPPLLPRSAGERVLDVLVPVVGLSFGAFFLGCLVVGAVTIVRWLWS